ncbi:MAG: RNA polymerase sigma factor, partial [Solirubrobacteraceae bacterium]
MGVVVMQAGAAVLADPAGADDAALVEAVRRGDDRAFEELYARYLPQITGFVAGRVHDHARAEDIAQDVFVSALRRIRATESAIAFRPWIYEIARNACIDAYRRGRRAEQVPLDSERLAPADRDRLVAGGPAPEAAVAVKEELDHLRGAFGSLSDAHHEILVLRELEGLSYEAIGERLGMTKAGVESTLFRARRRLGEEYEDLASGERCASVQGIVADSGHRRLGVRERRRVTSHAAHCDPCRRLAVRAGFEIDVPRRRRVARRLGAWLPIPAILRRGGEQAATAVAGRGGWFGQLPGLLEPGWGKAVAGVAALAIAGAG